MTECNVCGKRLDDYDSLREKNVFDIGYRLNISSAHNVHVIGEVCGPCGNDLIPNAREHLQRKRSDAAKTIKTEKKKITTGFAREELIAIREEAERSARQCSVLHSSDCWVWAYKRLASAADHLDAMIARSLVEKEE